MNIFLVISNAVFDFTPSGGSEIDIFQQYCANAYDVFYNPDSQTNLLAS